MLADTTRPSARILVVDDVEIHRRLVEILLTGEGYTVDLAGTAREALASVIANPPDAVVLDLALPDMHGLELLGMLRADAAEIPILIVSGDTTRSAKPTWRSRCR